MTEDEKPLRRRRVLLAADMKRALITVALVAVFPTLNAAAQSPDHALSQVLSAMAKNHEAAVSSYREAAGPAYPSALRDATRTIRSAGFSCGQAVELWQEQIGTTGVSCRSARLATVYHIAIIGGRAVVRAFHSTVSR
jgi:hypothetical protein